MKFCQGKRPRDTSSQTVKPSGNNGDCGKIPSLRDNAFVWLLVNRFAIKQYRTAHGLQDTCNGAEQRRLSTAVCPNQNGHFFCGNGEGNTINNDLLVIPGRNIVEDQPPAPFALCATCTPT